MSKKYMRTRSGMLLPGWESQNIVRRFPMDEKTDAKPCKKVYFSQIKRVSKEDMKMKVDKDRELLKFEEMYRASRRGRHVWGKKKCTIIPKRVKKDTKQPQNDESKPDNKGTKKSE